MSRLTLFADIILPLPLKAIYTYRVPMELNDAIIRGQRVVVQFGPRKIYTGIVYHIHETSPQATSIKYILSILDDRPIVLDSQLTLWEWIANYYMCSIGEVMQAALPSAFKLTSETSVLLNKTSDDAPPIAITEIENRIISLLNEEKETPLSELIKISGQKEIIPVIQSLLGKELITLSEEVQQKYKPRTESIVKIHDDYNSEDALRILFDSFSGKAVKQLHLLMSYVELSRIFSGASQEVTKKDLLEKSNASDAQLKELVKKGILSIDKKIISRLPQYTQDENCKLSLTTEQQASTVAIKQQFEQGKDVVLLHGITGSGKTEIYISLIEEAIANNKQVLYLLPEIALTTQIISRLKKYFGQRIAVYHSRFNANERVEVWQALFDPASPVEIILGPRSALFLPYTCLGLIIVDEEHDPSYKQQDPAPRYNGRDTAIYLSSQFKCKVLLGSATPAVETYFNAQNGKYGLVELHKRYAGIAMPDIVVVDIREEAKKKNMHLHYSQILFDLMQEALTNKEQIILFQNRRGHSLYLECQACQWTPTCLHCDVSLTYHKQTHQLVCHYCGYTKRIEQKCGQCKSSDIKMKGFGTEKIEEDIPLFFNNVSVVRMDLDSTRNKLAFEKIINDFENRRIDILVGTQMVTKGLDFDHVSLVGIINADNMLAFPDFRAHERCFQLLTQVSGRAGRKHKAGKVVIQTRNPEHPVITFVRNNDYKGFHQQQISERANFNYPPYYRLVSLKIKHKLDTDVIKASDELATLMKKHFGQLVLGPQWAIVSRVQNYYIKQILIKLPNNSTLLKGKQKISELIAIFASQTAVKSYRINIDVDPQ